MFVFVFVWIVVMVICWVLGVRFIVGSWHSMEDLRLWSRRAGMALTLFGGIDLVLLALLPQLGISFGPLYSTWICLFGLRVVLFFAVIPFFRDLLRWRVKITPRWRRGTLGLLLILNLSLYPAEVDAFYVEPLALQTTHLELSSPKLEPGTRLRIVHLTDLHMERTTAREREMIERVNALEPDLILVTGDYLNLSYLQDARAKADLREVLGALHARYGIYAVDGTIESPEELRELVAGLDITVLDDEVKPVQVGENRLYLVGISNRRPAELDVVALKAVMADVPAGAPTVLFYHTPDLMPEAAELKVDFYLAGHTHGGQIRLPFYGALLTFSRYGKQYEMGAYLSDSTHLYVSRGIGLEGSIMPRVRFLCPPEIVVVDLQNQEP